MFLWFNTSTAEKKSVQAVDQTPSCRPHGVIIIKMEVRNGSVLCETKYVLVICFTFSSNWNCSFNIASGLGW